MTLKDELPRSGGAQYTSGEERMNEKEWRDGGKAKTTLSVDVTGEK